MRYGRRSVVTRAQAALILLVLALGVPAMAQTTDPHLWTGVSVQGRAGANSEWRWNAEAQVRTRNGAGAVDLAAGLFSVSRTLTRRSSAGAAYSYGEAYPGSRTQREHRLLQQFSWTAGADWRVSFRTRVEERFISGADAVRVRQRIRVTWPLAAKGRLRGVASDELFATAAPRRTAQGVDSNELFIGIEQRVTPRERIEFGYANVFSPRARGARHSHVLSTAFVISL